MSRHSVPNWTVEEVAMLKQTLQGLLADECKPAAVRAAEPRGMSYAPDLWKRLAALGFIGLPLDSQHGGMGAPWEVTCLMQEMLGRALAPAPIVPSVFPAGLLIQSVEERAMREEWLPRIIGGECLVAASVGSEPFEEPPTATERAGGAEVRGTIRHLSLVDAAEAVAVVAVDTRGEPWLCLVSPLTDGFVPSPARWIDGERLCSAKLIDVPVASRARLRREALAEALGLSRLAHAAWMVGSGHGALDLAVAYAKERRQFGRPIGSFQALQHRMSDAALGLEAARQFVVAAARAVDGGGSAALAGVAARMLGAEAFVLAARVAQQVHGGYGYMGEADVQLYYRKAARAAFVLGESTRDCVSLGQAVLRRPELIAGLIGRTITGTE
jgi:alkylation response protein AidB-like acyl-CoA dehydrogenase